MGAGRAWGCQSMGFEDEADTSLLAVIVGIVIFLPIVIWIYVMLKGG